MVLETLQAPALLVHLLVHSIYLHIFRKLLVGFINILVAFRF